MAQKNISISAGTSYELAVSFESANVKPRVIVVANRSTSANDVEIIVPELHSDTNAAPGDSDEGVLIGPGQERQLSLLAPSGGRIAAVYAKSAGASIDVAEVMK